MQKFHRRLRYESLEDRRLLATDLAQITGVITNDLSGDGVTTVVASGQTLELYVDDGDTVFDPVSGGGGDIAWAAQPTTTSAADGSYSFDNLTAGSYFVRVVPTAGQQTRANTEVSSLITFNATEAMGATNLTIDSFGNAQSVSVSSAGSVIDESADGTNADSGDVRDMRVELTSGAGQIDLISDFVGTGILNLASTGSAKGIVNIVWDGSDGSASTIDTSNLSLDLSNGGANSAILLDAASDLGGSVTIRLYSAGGRTSETDVAIVDNDAVIDGDASESITVPFTAFDTSAGTGVDLSAIQAIEVEIDFRSVGTPNALDAQIDVVGIVGFTTRTENFTVLNRMSLGDQVWIDLDNDGVFEAGEVGVEDVAVTLYEDTDKDGDYTDEMAVDTALTDATGNYLFENRFPGDYIVQIDSANFSAGNPLNGLTTSTGNDVMSMAPDPDSDEDNNEDRGTLQGDSSVTSKAVTLLGNGEPINDGDTDNNTNRTLDFGFFGYDLVISKGVDATTAAPNDALVYTVTVTNNGPSTATNVDLTDTLPTGVTFTSGSTTVGGQAVSGSAGSQTVTSTIGTLLNGQSATITINATIGAAATGTLTNSAVTSGTDESNTTNNTATAATVIQPEINLTITKVDDDGGLTLAPSGTIQYTLGVTNNGPSGATNVIVTDLLPTGLTFNATGSTVPTSTTAVAGGTQLTYNLGSLANGAALATPITINATIGSTFTGLLTNTASVAATETETDALDNTASAQSVVAIEPSTISGFVYVDADNDGAFDSGELPIAGVALTLTGTDFNGPVSKVVTTNANGFYEFTGLLPGTYTVTETQPTFFPDGQDSATFAGATVGADVISTIVLGLNQEAPENNFGELPPTLSKRSFLASNI